MLIESVSSGHTDNPSSGQLFSLDRSKASYIARKNGCDIILEEYRSKGKYTLSIMDYFQGAL